MQKALLITFIPLFTCLFSIVRAATPPPGPVAQEMTFEKLVKLIRDENAVSLEDVLGKLPSEMTDLNYVLMYRSRSLQEATPREPRAILFTPSAKLIVTFNGGSPDKRGADTLEIIQYRDQSKSFEFREIEFTDGQTPKISQANPARCTECHQSPDRKDVDMRPNWEPYNMWPGAFGSNSGHVGESMRQSYRAKEIFLPEDKDMLDEQEREPQFVKTFFADIQPRHPRYRFLKTFKAGAAQDLTDRLSRLAFHRMSRLIADESQIIKAFAPAIASQLGCGETLKSKSKFLSWNYTHAPARYPSAKFSRTAPGQIVTPLFESMGVDTSDWSMDFLTRGRFSFCDRFCAPGYPDMDFVAALNVAFPGIDRYYTKNCYENLNELDAQLEPFFAAGEHLRLAKRWQPTPPDAQLTLRRCANCHTVDVRPGTPQIDFLNTSVLKSELAKTGYARGTLLQEILFRTGATVGQRLQMPPSRPLAPEEQAALSGYLGELVR